MIEACIDKIHRHISEMDETIFRLSRASRIPKNGTTICVFHRPNSVESIAVDGPGYKAASRVFHKTFSKLTGEAYRGLNGSSEIPCVGTSRTMLSEQRLREMNIQRYTTCVPGYITEVGGTAAGRTQISEECGWSNG